MIRIALIILAAASASLRAHELDIAATLSAPAVCLRATYAGAGPVPFAAVQVFAPGAAEFQNGRTDRRGGFSFLPDASGSWRIVIDDEEGHRREATVHVPESFTANTPADAAPPEIPRLWRALTGVSLLVGATGFLYGFKVRRAAPPQAPR
ncbi:MAG: hypothetical protein IT164_12305 [Bryobacterales bacterium]|nr:hypothetical protein [Bryobacterales bacterium]